MRIIDPVQRVRGVLTRVPSRFEARASRAGLLDYWRRRVHIRMKGFLERMQWKMAGAMQGRRGADSLSSTLVVAGIVCLVLSVLPHMACSHGLRWRFWPMRSSAPIRRTSLRAIARTRRSCARLRNLVARFPSDGRNGRTARPRCTSSARAAGRSFRSRVARERFEWCAQSARPKP